MEAKVPRQRRARVLGLAAAFALLAMLLPATAGIALGHAAYSSCGGTISNDWTLTAKVYVHGSVHNNSTFVANLPAATGSDTDTAKFGVVTVAPGTYDIVWSDNFEQDNLVITYCTAITTVANPSTGTVGVSITPSDQATVTGGSTLNGESVSFSLYKGAACTGTAVVTGTAKIASGVAAFTDPSPLTPSAPGTYTWYVSYGGDKYNDSFTACGGANETVVITKTSPSLGTVPSAGGLVGKVLNDSATLTGAYNPTGSITFALYGANDTTCASDPIYTQTVALSGNGASTFPGWTTVAAGTYEWKASYPGDTNNGPASSGCGLEAVVITKTGMSIATQLYDASGKVGGPTTVNVGDSVHDTATLTVTAAPDVFQVVSPTVTYTVYTDATCKTEFALAGSKTVTNGIVPPSDSVVFNTPGTYYWQAVYSGDDGTTGATSACTDETLVVTQDGPSISTTLSASSVALDDTTTSATVFDTAKLTDASANAGGTVTYTVYFCGTDNGTCATTTVFKALAPVLVTNGTVPNSPSVTFTKDDAGFYCWQAVYSGDANNAGFTSKCTDEPLQVAYNGVQGETATPTAAGTTIVEAATGTPVVTPAVTSTDGNSSNGNTMPLFAILICIAFGGIGLLAVQAQRQSIRR